MRAASLAYSHGFGIPPLFLRNGGTVSVVGLLAEQLQIHTVMMGFASANDHLHGPDEKFRLKNYFRGIETSIWFLALLGESSSGA